MADPDRPLLHFTAREGWINDPLAVTWHGGVYHLFFQHVPGSDRWDVACRWGHAISDDLVHWTELPVALEPGDGDDGVWSGALAVDDAGGATILYTSAVQPHLGIGRIRVATALDDEWIRWRKGPVVVEAPPVALNDMFRDPFVARDGNGWRMLVGAALADGDGVALGFTSPDLRHWRFTGIAARRAAETDDGVWTGRGWECPQVVRVDGADVLVCSAWEHGAIHHVVGAVGEWRDGRFTARHWQRIGWGAAYAATVFRDRNGRPCLMSWVRDAAGDGWIGALTVPSVLRLVRGRIVLEPHPDVTAAAAAAGRPVREVRPGDPLGNGVLLQQAGQELVLCDGERELARIPSRDGRARLLLDGPVIEVWTDAGALACGARKPQQSV